MKNLLLLINMIKYIEERKYIELNLIKTINYQYLHTLYHELNNPLNALLAISGENEKTQLYSSELTNSRIEYKPTTFNKKTKKIFNTVFNDKKDKNNVNFSLSNNKLSLNPDILEYKTKKKTYNENNDLYNKIPLLVNIIKIFIKNCILYLKIRADNLIMLKNEFNLQNETSDIMNAIEVSEYEKELTKHKLVKINLQYIFDLYFEKFLCLFKYKEIDFETNFDKLKNLYVITDEFNFIYYIRQIYTYLYYIVPKKEGFIFDYNEDQKTNKIKIIIKKRNDGNTSKRTDEQYESFLKSNIINKENKDKLNDMSQVIQTKEMTKEVLYSMSKTLNFNLEIFDLENNELNNKNIYLCITMSIQRKDKGEEEDDFKDEDINEMVVKDSIMLEEKLKRQLPSNSFFEAQKASNVSTIHIMEMLNKSGEERKFSIESFISVNKTNVNNINNNSCNNHIKGRNSEYNTQKNSLYNLNLNDSQKKLNSNKNISNNSLLNKIIKESELKKMEKSKFIINSFSENVILLNKNLKGKKLRNSSTEVKNNDEENEKNKNIETNEKNLLKNQKIITNGIFSIINNNNAFPNETIKIDKHISEISIDLNKNKRDEMTFKEQSAFVSGYASSIKIKGNDNKPSNNQINNDNLYSVITCFFGKKNQIKKKSSCFVSEINGDNEDENLERNGVILIELENSKDIKGILKKSNFSNKSNLCIIKEENHKKLKSCGNIFNLKNTNNKTSNIDDKKEIYKKTEVDNSMNHNQKLFIKAIQESKYHIQKTKNKNRQLLFSRSSENKSKKKYGSESDFFDSDEECNCAGILVVDDEEFNVMATQKMLKNLGLDSDAAYNGEECINLINEKIKLNCKCKSSYYKLIFLDIVMPIMDGIETAKRIQEMIDKKIINDNTKIVFISGNIDGSNLQNSLLQIKCVKECLQKPVKIAKYQKILEKYYNDN